MDKKVCEKCLKYENYFKEKDKLYKEKDELYKEKDELYKEKDEICGEISKFYDYQNKRDGSRCC